MDTQPHILEGVKPVFFPVNERTRYYPHSLWVIRAEPHKNHWSFFCYRVSCAKSDTEPCFDNPDTRLSDPAITIEIAQWDMQGDVKWDGCSNWEFPARRFHFCEKRQMQEFGEVLMICSDWADATFHFED